MTAYPIGNTIDEILSQVKISIESNYEELIKIGNPEGEKTLRLSYIVFMAKSISSLSKENIQKLRRDGVLDF